MQRWFKAWILEWECVSSNPGPDSYYASYIILCALVY